MTQDTHAPVGEDELHAFVDGQLDAQRLAAVLDWLQAHPGDALRVAQWHAQRLQLKQLHRTTDPGPVPEALTRVVLARSRRPAWPGQAAAAAVLLLVGVLAGRWWGAGPTEDALAGAEPPGFAREAAVAHAVYSPEVRHPVEVAAADEAHLVQWLSRRLGAPLRVPVLHGRGFRLLGGRLLPGGDRAPRAQFMYEDAQGRRLTLYVSVFAPNAAPAETAFRSLREGAHESFYWVEGRFGYALGAELPSPELMALAREVYAQLAR